MESISYQQLFAKHYINMSPNRFVSFDFLSPTAFKSNGTYINIPTPRLIFSGLAKRYDGTCQIHDALYEALFSEIEQNITIFSYYLRSTVFHLEGVHIPSFQGSITLRVTGNETFLSYINMLAEYASYAGIGIKTALGMGNVSYHSGSQKRSLI